MQGRTRTTDEDQTQPTQKRAWRFYALTGAAGVLVAAVTYVASLVTGLSTLNDVWKKVAVGTGTTELNIRLRNVELTGERVAWLDGPPDARFDERIFTVTAIAEKDGDARASQCVGELRAKTQWRGMLNNAVSRPQQFPRGKGQESLTYEFLVSQEEWFVSSISEPRSLQFMLKCNGWYSPVYTVEQSVRTRS